MKGENKIYLTLELKQFFISFYQSVLILGTRQVWVGYGTYEWEGYVQCIVPTYGQGMVPPYGQGMVPTYGQGMGNETFGSYLWVGYGT